MSHWYKRRRWVYGVLAALLLLDAVVYFGWVRNPAAVADADPAQVALLEEEVAELAAEVERLEQVQVQAPQLGPQLDRFVAERFLEESTGFSRVNAELNRAARGAGVLKGPERVGVILSGGNAAPETVAGLLEQHA